MIKPVDRRAFLKRSAVCACGVAAWGAFPWFDLPKAYAANGNGTKLLIINMNGGWDGLYVMQPTSSQIYDLLRSYRPTLGQDPGSLLNMGNGFGFHPALSIFKSLYDEGKLAAISNVGYNNMSRSHADAEVTYARGVTDRLNPAASGFIARIGAEYQWHNLQAVSISGTDRAFEGTQYRGIQVNGLWDYRFTGDSSQNSSENSHRRDTIYGASQSWAVNSEVAKQVEIQMGISNLMNSCDNVKQALDHATFASSYPDTELGNNLRDADVLFSTSGLGTEVAYVRRGGFDSHSNQRDGIDHVLTEFNQAFSTFVTNMKTKNIWDRLIVLVISEFGRTNRENDSLGTDHGGALPVFLAGGQVRGGIVGEIMAADLTGNSWLPMRYNIVEIYRRIFAQMGYDPNRIFESQAGAQIPGLFV